VAMKCEREAALRSAMYSAPPTLAVHLKA